MGIEGEGSSQGSMTESISKTRKEEHDNEEKEKDDRESECKSSDSNHSNDHEDRTKQSKTVGTGDVSRSSPFSLNSSAVNSPRQGRKSENIPILSGGSTLKREKDS